MTAEPTRGRASVVVVSTQAAADPALDRTGPVIADWLRGRGFAVTDPVIVSDGGPIAETVTAELLAGARVLVTTGGTGVTPTDRTPEAVRPLLDLELPGITEEIRRRGLAGAGPTALLSRGVAGIAGAGVTAGSGSGAGALVVTLPGSRGGVADGLTVIDGVLDHLLAQLHGDGHAPRSAS